MMLPTVHLNGTSKKELLDEAMACMTLLRTTIRSMEHAPPNGRDYYPQGPSAVFKAMNEHAGRIEALRNVLHDYESLVEHLTNSGAR